MTDKDITIVRGWCGQDCKCSWKCQSLGFPKRIIWSEIKAADAKIDKEISQYKKLGSHLSKKLSEENKKVEDLQKELEVW